MNIHKQHKQHKTHKTRLNLPKEDIDELILHLSQAVKDITIEARIGNPINETHFNSLENTLERLKDEARQ